MGFNCYSNSLDSFFRTFDQWQIKNEVTVKFFNIKAKNEDVDMYCWIAG
jgi:hypothetical protein